MDPMGEREAIAEGRFQGMVLERLDNVVINMSRNTRMARRAIVQNAKLARRVDRLEEKHREDDQRHDRRITWWQVLLPALIGSLVTLFGYWVLHPVG